MTIVYFIYDGRFHTDPDRALVMEVCDTLEEARKNRRDYGDDCVIVAHLADADGLIVDPGEVVE